VIWFGIGAIVVCMLLILLVFMHGGGDELRMLKDILSEKDGAE